MSESDIKVLSVNPIEIRIGEKKKLVTFKLEEYLHDELKNVAKEYNMSASEFIRLSLYLTLSCPEVIAAIHRMAVLNRQSSREIAKEMAERLLCRYRQNLV